MKTNETKVFSLFGNSGIMEEIKPIGNLPIYSRVIAYGFAMAEYVYAVIDDNNNLVKMSTNREDDYFGAFHKFDKYDKLLSKKFGIGFYYDDIESDFRFDKTAVIEAIDRGNEFENYLKVKAEEKAENDKNEINSLPKLYPYLTPIKEGNKNKIQLMNNIRAILKYNFKGVKFSVRREHYSSCVISWTDGPTVNDVEKYVNLFEDHSPDWSGDFSDYNPSNFNAVFGGIQFVSTNRNMSDKVETLIYPICKELFKKDPFSCNSFENFAYRLFVGCTIPINGEVVGVKGTGENHGLSDPRTFYCLDIKTIKEEEKPQIAEKCGDIQIVNYSEKAIAVIGNTKAIKDTLKAIGGRFNFRLSCGAGWIFPATKLESVRTALNL